MKTQQLCAEGFTQRLEERYQALYRSGEMSLSKNYSDKFPLLEHCLREAVRGKSVLDFGCGPGRLSLMLARWSARVHGMDFAPAGIELAGLLAQVTETRNVSFSVGDVSTLAAMDRTYEVAVLAGVLEHCPEPVRMLRSLCKVLTPDGLLVVQSPSFANFRGDAYNTLLNLLKLPMSLTDLFQVTPRHIASWAQELDLTLERVVGGHYALGYLERVLDDFRQRIPAAARDAGVSEQCRFDQFFSWMQDRIEENRLLIEHAARLGLLKPVPPSAPLSAKRPPKIDNGLWTSVSTYLTYDGWREPYYSDTSPWCYLGASATYLLRKSRGGRG